MMLWECVIRIVETPRLTCSKFERWFVNRSVAEVERELAAAARLSPACTRLLSVLGIGLLTASTDKNESTTDVVTTALAVVSRIGVDMSRFATVKHFTSWLGLCPGTKITGGKVMSDKCCVNRAAQALRLAAAALCSSKSALGAYFRLLCSCMDKPKAVTAAAHKLARLIYMMLTQGQ